MGNCMYCGEPIGFLRKKHKECEAKFEAGRNKIISLVRRIDSTVENMESLSSQISQIANSSFITSKDKQEFIVLGWERAVEQAFDDGVLTEKEESILDKIIEHFSLSQSLLDKNGAFTKVVKGAVLRDVLEGKIPQKIKIEGNLPFNLQKAEKIIWIFQNVDYYEQKTRRAYVGGSKGFSIRIAKGVYYRAGAFKGHSVQHTETVHSDRGLLGITNKHIYFSGSAKSFRIRHDKIIAFEPYSDGIGVQRDAATAKPQTFITGEGWFTYNLITNVAQL